MEINDQSNLPLLLRLSERPEREEKPPNLLKRITTPPLRKRGREPSRESRERWKFIEKDNIPVSKRQRVSPTNWANGQEHQTRKGEKPMTRTLQRSTPTLLSRMRSDRIREERPPLLARLTQPANRPAERESERRLRNSWIRYPEKSSMETLMDTSLDSYQHGRELEKRICLGSTHPSTPINELAVSKPAELCLNSVRISPGLNHFYESPTAFPRESPQPSGTKSFEVSPLTSIRSSPPCTLSTLMKRERDTWELLRSYLPWQNPNVKSKQELSGRQCLDGCQRRSSSFSLIGGKNYTSMPSTSRVSSPPNTPMLTLRSSSTTNQSATRLEEARTLYSPTINTSVALAKPSYMLMESNTRVEAREKAREETVQRRERAHQKRTFAGASTARADVASQMRSAITSTSAKVVEKLDMERTPAPPTNHSELQVINGMRPKYLRYNIWDPDSEFTPNTADWTLTAKPLEGPPQLALDDEPVTQTKVTTAIRIDIFETYLASHPNRPFVKSVVMVFARDSGRGRSRPARVSQP